MKKTYKYTVLTVVLAIVFSFGSMAGMNLILKARERQLLTKSGRSVMEVPVQTNVGQEKDQNFNKDRGTLTIEQIEKVVSLWDEPDEVVVHNPADGQISMGEAIRAGQEWLINMGMEVERKDNDEVHQYATLSTAVRKSSEGEDDNQDVQTAPYNSFWRVQFYSSSLEAYLYVNAATGQVWSADIILYDDFPKEIPSKKLRDFVELCGLKVSGSESEEELWQPSYSWMERVEIENSKLIAEMQFMRSQTGYPGSGYGIGRAILENNRASLLCFPKNLQL